MGFFVLSQFSPSKLLTQKGKTNLTQNIYIWSIFSYVIRNYPKPAKILVKFGKVWVVHGDSDRKVKGRSKRPQKNSFFVNPDLLLNLGPKVHTEIFYSDLLLNFQAKSPDLSVCDNPGLEWALPFSHIRLWPVLS